MKRVAQSLLFCSLSLTFSALAFAAGGMEGGGGGVAVCRDANHKITFAVMEDLYEGQYKYHYTIPSSADSPDRQVAAVIAKIRDAFNRTAVTEAVSQTISAMTFLPEGVGLAPTTDLGNEFGILIPDGCAIEPVGFYDFGGTLEVSRDIYSHLDATNRAAFIMHEALYKLARKTAGDTNSASARFAVSSLFATDSSNAEGILDRTIVFPFYPSEWGNRKFFTAKVVVSHPDRNFTLKVHPKNDGKYKAALWDRPFDAYQAGAPLPDGFIMDGDVEISFIDNYDFSALTVTLETFDAEPSKNLSQVFDFQILDDASAVIYSGSYDPNSVSRPEVLAVALARVSVIPPIPVLGN